MKYRTGLVIGRFQPFHKGHLYLIKQALKQADKLVIAIGSVNVKNEDNPFSYEERKEFITLSLQKHNLIKKIKTIVPINDFLNDDGWTRELVKQVGRFDVVFSNNEWSNNILEKSGYKVVRVLFNKREKYEGAKIREELKRSKKPKEVLKKYMP